jgi:hypothetical protein
VRLLDTRVGTGLSGPFLSSVPRTFRVAGVAGGVIPGDAVAITGNVTVVGQTAAGYVSLTPDPTSTPFSSTINVPRGDVRANNFTIPLNRAGDLAAVYKATGGASTHLVIDVTGYFVSGGSGATYQPVTPARILDSRVGNGLSGKFTSSAPRTLQVAGRGGVPAAAIAVTGNLTVTNHTRDGYVSMTSEPTSEPTTSTLNFPAGDNRANGVSMPLRDGKVSLVYMAGAAATADLIFDVTGYYVEGGAGLRFYPLNPARIMDTRRTDPTALEVTGAFTSAVPRLLRVGGRYGVPEGASAVAGNLTVVGQTSAGYASITLQATSTPTVSTLNFPIGDVRANGATFPVPVDSGDVALVYKASAGARTHLVLDLAGYYK